LANSWITSTISERKSLSHGGVTGHFGKRMRERGLVESGI
jgi:hypothetical protein